MDTLKPKNPLNEEMTLEEAQLWFKNYRAHLAYNKDALAKQEIQVQRAMLDVDLDPRMASALRSHERITDETRIDAIAPEVGCLETLREIFLEKNPLWLRRHWYFQCVQKQNETVEQWWNRKKDKSRQCDLEKMNVQELQMLELIRGISSFCIKERISQTTRSKSGRPNSNSKELATLY